VLVAVCHPSAAAYREALAEKATYWILPTGEPVQSGLSQGQCQEGVKPANGPHVGSLYRSWLVTPQIPTFSTRGVLFIDCWKF
jgi:hypothetical protein